MINPETTNFFIELSEILREEDKEINTLLEKGNAMVSSGKLEAGLKEYIGITMDSKTTAKAWFRATEKAVEILQELAWWMKGKVNPNLLLIEQFYLLNAAYYDRRLETNPKKVTEIAKRKIRLDTARFVIETPYPSPGLPDPDHSQALDYFSSTVCAQGHRKEQEDDYTTKTLSVTLDYSHTEEVPFFMVLDSHRGKECGDFVKETLPKEISIELAAQPDHDHLNMFNCLKKAFQRTEEKWTQHAHAIGSRSGCCALAVLIHKEANKRALWIANTGDCRAVLIKDDEVKQLTVDQRAYVPELQRSILKRGGTLEGGRLNGILEPVRTFGDCHKSLQGKTARPKINWRFLSSQWTNPYLILATDGLWDVIGSQEAADLTKNVPHHERAAKLVKTALEKGAPDNVTVMVVKLY